MERLTEVPVASFRLDLADLGSETGTFSGTFKIQSGTFEENLAQNRENLLPDEEALPPKRT